jgi:glutaminyl-peptide cyclotransferase
MKVFKIIPFIIAPAFLFSCTNKKNTETAYDSLAMQYTVLSVLPHDASAFTEGLEISNNKILESTGQNGSWIAEVDPGTGTQNKKIVLDDRYFGEGITMLNNKIYQLTYKTKICFVYDANTYKQIGSFNYNMAEGWGLTHDDKNIIMSDGSEKIYFLDTTNFKVARTVTVMDGNIPVKKINELEYVNGHIYANVWETSLILKINPVTGKVIGRLDLSVITNEIKRMYPDADVLNGIAYDRKSKAFLVTGKLWPKAYLIRLQ